MNESLFSIELSERVSFLEERLESVGNIRHSASPMRLRASNSRLTGVLPVLGSKVDVSFLSKVS